MKKIEYQEVIETNGIKVPFVPEIITPKIERPMRNSRYEGGECKALREVLRPDDRVLEFGAGVGLLSTVSALQEGVGSVTTVEANPELIPLIKETHKLNDAKNITILNGVVSAKDAEDVNFYLRADFWASSMEAESRDYKSVQRLKNYNVNNLLGDIRPTVIACDIEGAEFGLFDESDLSDVRCMILELHPKVYGDAGVEQICAVLKSKGLEPVDVDKPSSVRLFVRREYAQSQEPNLMPARTYRPWQTKKAKFLVATCMKDEGPFILEWLAWHKAIGIQEFVVFTNDCTDGTDAMLDRLQELGHVTHLPNPALASGSAKFQPLALNYIHYMREFREADFFISMDVDEFINIRKGTGKMADLLEATGPFDALSISEINHGANMREEYEEGWITEQFTRHQTENPGKWKSHRGVKTIVRLSEKLLKVRNHRPSFAGQPSDVTWLNGSGAVNTSLPEDEGENGIDSRNTYDLVSLDHYALRSLNSYLAKMFRGDVVVKDKPVSQRYWRQRNQNADETSTLERPKKAAMTIYRGFLKDKKLKTLHDKSCKAHQDCIGRLLKDPVFQTRKQWVFDECWDEK